MVLPQPGLLPREKENRLPPLWKSTRLDLPDWHPQSEGWPTAVPSPGGEGQVEGERSFLNQISFLSLLSPVFDLILRALRF
jgi:hypothetical protein